MKHTRFKIISPIIILGLAIFLLFNTTIKENFAINNAIGNFADFYSTDVKILSVDGEKNDGKPVRLKVGEKYLLELSDSKNSEYSANLKLDNNYKGKSFKLGYNNNGELYPFRDLGHLMGFNTLSIMASVVILLTFLNLIFQLFNISTKKRYKNNSVSSDKYSSHAKVYHYFIFITAVFYGFIYLIIRKSNIYLLQDVIYVTILALLPIIVYFVLNYNLKTRKYYKFAFDEEHLAVFKNRRMIFEENYKEFKFYTSLDKIKSIGSKTLKKYYLQLIPYDSEKPVLFITLYNFDEESFKELKDKLKDQSYYDSMFNNGKYYDQEPLTLLVKPRNKILDTTLLSFLIITVIAAVVFFILYKYAKAFFIIGLFSYAAIAVILITLSIIFAVRNKYIKSEFKIDHNINIDELIIPEEEVKSIKMTNPIYTSTKKVVKLKIASSDGKYSFSIKPVVNEENNEVTNESRILLYDLLMYEYGNFTTIE